MAKIIYDPEVKVLSIRFKDKKSADSDIKDNVVFDYDEKGDLVNIDVMDINIDKLLDTTKNKVLKKQK